MTDELRRRLGRLDCRLPRGCRRGRSSSPRQVEELRESMERQDSFHGGAHLDWPLGGREDRMDRGGSLGVLAQRFGQSPLPIAKKS